LAISTRALRSSSDWCWVLPEATNEEQITQADV